MAYEFEGHAFGKVKGISWACCKNCGLLRFNNPLTHWMIKKGCYADEHPGFRNATKSLVYAKV